MTAMEFPRFRLIDLLIQPIPQTDRPLRNRLKAALKWHFLIALLINILSLSLPIMMLQVYDRIIPHQSYGTLTLLVSGVVAALLCETLLRLARAQLTARAASRQEDEVGRAAIDHLTRADLTEFARVEPAAHLQNMMALGRLREFYSGQALTAVIDMPFIAIFLGIIAYLGGVLVLVPLALLAVFAVTAVYVGNRLKAALAVRAEVDDRKMGFIVQILSGIHAVKSFGIESRLVSRYAPYQDEATRASHAVALESGAAGILSAVFGQLSLILTATAGAFLVLDNQLSVGGLTACTLLAGRAIQPVQRVLGTWLRTQDLAVARAQADALFALPLCSRENAALPPPEGALSLERVSYAVDGREILHHINLECLPGEMISINGAKGSGKTTLLQLMAGVRKPSAGALRLDGAIDPSRHESGALRHHVGYMPQTGTIYKGTILENLTGFDESEDAVARAIEACRILELDRVIHHLPHGYDTVLGDHHGDPVPPGVKQRIALTRVLAHDPAILLFDDADRTLDKPGYNALFQYLGACRGEKTVILATHDQNILMLSNRHFFLDRGLLKESAQNIAFFGQTAEGR